MNTEWGVLLAIFGGVMVGNCMVPLKYLRRWRWENAWIVFSFVALVLLPCSLAILSVPNLLTVYAHVGTRQFVEPFLYGAGWGVAQVLFGLAIVRVGMALGFAITIGLSAALGTLVPILFKHPEILATGRGFLVSLGMFLMLGGVVSCSWGGWQMEKDREGEPSSVDQRSYAGGLLMAVAAGLLAPMLNYALAFGDTFIVEAVHQGASHPNAPYAVWPIALAGGMIPNTVYAIYLMFSNKTWGFFVPVWPDILLSSTMGILWMGSIAVYGMATAFLGVLGSSIGWSIFQICMILTANISGWIAGEWSGARLTSRLARLSGLLLLASATVVIAYGNQ